MSKAEQILETKLDKLDKELDQMKTRYRALETLIDGVNTAITILEESSDSYQSELSELEYKIYDAECIIEDTEAELSDVINCRNSAI